MGPLMPERPDIEHLLALADGATPGPWMAWSDVLMIGTGRCKVVGRLGKRPGGEPQITGWIDHRDAELMAASREGLPALARYALSLEAEVARLRGLAEVAALDMCDHYGSPTECPDKWPDDHAEWCASCCARAALDGPADA